MKIQPVLLFVILALLAANLAGCAPAAAPPTLVPEPPTVAPPPPTATPVPPPPTATPVPPPPTPAMMPEQGTLEKGTITSPALAGNLLGDPDTRRYFIYLPPSYHVSDKRYPVVYMLHDSPSMAELEQTGLRPLLDAMIKAGDIGELIAVFPNAVPGTDLSLYRSSSAIGDYEAYISRDLVDTIDATYRTIADAGSRAVASVSVIDTWGAGTGANGALHLALTHPDVFGAVGAVYGLYDVEAAVDAWLRNFRLNPKPENNPVFVTAIVSPNPDNPPLFADPLFQQIDGEWNIPVGVREKLRLLDPVSDLEAYANQPDRLRDILIVQPAAFAADGQALDEAMTALGIDHQYVEYDGPYIARTLQQMLLDFLAETLVFEQE